MKSVISLKTLNLGLKNVVLIQKHTCIWDTEICRWIPFLDRSRKIPNSKLIEKVWIWLFFCILSTKVETDYGKISFYFIIHLYLHIVQMSFGNFRFFWPPKNWIHPHQAEVYWIIRIFINRFKEHCIYTLKAS